MAMSEKMLTPRRSYERSYHWLWTAAPKILELLRYKLSRLHLSILDKGLKFLPTTLANHSDIKSDFYSFTRKLGIREIFHDEENADESLVFNKSTKQFKPQNKEFFNIINQLT